jgi:hypothetical protein
MEDIDQKIEAGEPLMQQVLRALRRYNEAKGLVSVEEAERLRIEVEALMIAVSQYQLHALGGPAPSLH